MPTGYAAHRFDQAEKMTPGECRIKIDLLLVYLTFRSGEQIHFIISS